MLQGHIFLSKRDIVDARLTDDVRNRIGKIKDSQTQVGGWPDLKSAEAPLDSDNDGMPDAWEIAHKLNPHDPSDANLVSDKNGYTNVENYLNSIDPQK